MSRRRSTGDLVPRDITEILAREARAQRGQRKPGGSLGLAFSWLKGGKKKKKSVGNGQNRNGAGVTDAKLGFQNQEAAKAGPKGNEDHKRLTVHYTTSQHYQENVFIEGSRPQYLENLHIEAQEGLKIQQQEENKNGVNFPDDESIASTDTLRPEQGISSKDGGGSPDSGSTTGNTDNTVTSTVSTRPVLTRQGSTFKPLNPVKRLDKSKKRSRRTTIMGIPNQVQKELALHRNSTFQPLVSTQLSSKDRQICDGQPGVVIIPTVDGGTPAAKKEGARVHLSELETFSDDQLVRKHLQMMYQDEQSLNHQGFGTYLCPTSNLRPKSLAVPGMTTSSSFTPSMFSFLQEAQGPVMSISPQATYLSTIIPNAILPASVEVIEIDRSSSRTHSSSINHGGSVRTVSKSSLTSGDSSVSPLLSRRSDDDGSQNESSQIPASVSGSNWSESSRTVKSNSSPVSSKASTRSGNSQRAGLSMHEGKTEQTHGDQDLVSLGSSVSVISSPNGKSENTVTELGVSDSVADREHPKRSCNRSLSIMKTKQPPAPPRRTNSLHGNKIRGHPTVQVYNADLNDHQTVEVITGTENVPEEIKKLSNTDQEIIPNITTSSGSPDFSSTPLNLTQDTSTEAGKATEQSSEYGNSSPRKTLSEGGKFERTMSPSSGYSSQSGTPTHSPKEISPTSPEKQKKTPVKPERSVSRASSSAASPSSSLTSLSSGTSELANTDISLCSSSLPPHTSLPNAATKEPSLENDPSSFTKEIKELLNIPPPPKVKAPCPPPPETWAHNRHTFELLCGSHTSINKVVQKPAQQHDDTNEQIGNEEEPRKETQVSGESQTEAEKSLLEERQTKHPDIVHSEREGEESTRQENPLTENKDEADVVVLSQEKACSSVVNELEIQVTTPKKEPPPVMKKPNMALHREETRVTEQSSKTQQKNTNGSATPEIELTVEDHTSSQNNLTVMTDKSEDETEKSEAPSVQTLAIEAPKLTKASPPPTPPPAYHPTPPPSRKTPSSVSVPLNELQRVQEEMHAVESCWPPPPPPLEGDPAFDGADEVDFPPPPPPFLADIGPEVMDNSMTQVDTLNGSTLEHSDVHATSLEAASPDDEPLVEQLSDTNAGEEDVSSAIEQNVSLAAESVSPALLESPPIPTLTRAESPVSIIAAGPPTNFLTQSSLKIEDQCPPSIPNNVQPPAPTTVPLAPALPAETLTHGVNFRRQPSVPHRDTRNKELLSRHKSALIPKEDANIPLVTPSLLQMVRLRSVNMTDDQVKAPTQDTKPTDESPPVEESCVASVQGSQSIPQKPIRKSLSLKSPPQHVKTSSVIMSTPSMRLQEAIRLKTAAMSSRDSLSSRLGVRSPMYSCIADPGALSLKSPEACDMHKSPASAASFIFSRSTKKVVVESAAASTPEAQAALKQNLVSELLLVSDQSKAATFSNGGVKCDKVPPPVAKKPAPGSVSPSHNHSPSSRVELSIKGNGANGGVQRKSGITLPETTTRVTADTIETLF
ncbi:NHS-like protein 3 isoform X2 [Salarias fasciatus]|uniref:NHS-like protein 3 isoform X2 n=1 Tax=Salarias fasciatus TaxID=181472 RepID=UPI001176EEE1|nr:uncharacterized protein KIAA1522 homolog isoform X2 [Salarias fasciatus]